MAGNKNKPIITVQEETPESKEVVKEKKKKVKKKPSSKTGTRKKEADPRVRIAIGIFMILISLFILIAFISYFFGYDFTGKVGEYIGEFMSKEMFGIGSLYLILLFIYGGFRMSFKWPNIKGWTIWKYSLVCLIWIPLLFALIYNLLGRATADFDKFSGSVGSWLYDNIEIYISNVGIIILLIFTAFLYVIFTFKINFSSFFRKEKKTDNEDVDITDGDDDTSEEPEEEPEGEITVIHKPVNKPINKPIIEEKPKKDTDSESAITIDLPLDDIDEPEDIEEHENEDIETEKPENEEDDDTSDIKMEITIPKEEKQAIEIGEHFGLDTCFDPKLELSDFQLPPLDLLKDYGDGSAVVDKMELEANKKRIVDTLANYSIAIDKIKATIGPTVTLYEIVPAAGVRISKIKGLQDDIALCLSAIGIRIIAPMPGKGTVGIEVPNLKPQIVSMKSILASERFQKSGYELPFGIGKTISNESYVADLTKMPHILMAGATGQGKSVGINAIIASLLYSKHPAELKFVLVDPKKVELSLYRKIERHYLAKLPDSDEAIITDIRKVVRTLNSLCIEMDNRYNLLKDAQVRNIKEYNAKFISRKLNPLEGHHFMPYIVLVVDEFADLMMTAGKEVESPITRLAQLARAIGIHLIIATQRPSVNIITGTIKANFPARIAFRVISRVDSSTILDSNGAEQLVGRGDMLLSTGNDLVRLQCPFIDTPEVEAVTDFIGSQRAYPDAYELPEVPDDQDENGSKEDLNSGERDPLFEEAAKIIVQTQQGSTSMLQRRLKLGYNRAGRIIDQLEKAGIVGPFAGSKQREVRVANEFALEQFLKDLDLDKNQNEFI